ncbi:MAG: hypothetical protein QT08_C0006G0004 [archaeon GW2011_AR17]|nr:MAG: hypothetical protein QT08_C0006G0004 [archaeon GW2011_AR17]MBS3154612.1 hypothetical protein [Candidatus Woesearchaeota archaeon]HIH14607.1 hypothetical protein [Nanoarchaeota archaeon]HIH58507.1 hypothetical protein [Nanoarchaeota archaeon]HII14276.1 hypothetical protein [Nanoarchaeota archaeon]
MKKRPEESVHVCLQMPVDKRRTILQATIDTMQLMKRYENLVRIRHEKDQHYAEFRRVLGIVNKLVKEVRVKELPLDAQDIRHVHKVKNESVMAPVAKKVEKVLHAKEKKKIVEERKPAIDRQIEDLQRKLQNL